VGTIRKVSTPYYLTRQIREAGYTVYFAHDPDPKNLPANIKQAGGGVRVWSDRQTDEGWVDYIAGAEFITRKQRVGAREKHLAKIATLLMKQGVWVTRMNAGIKVVSLGNIH